MSGIQDCKIVHRRERVVTRKGSKKDEDSKISKGKNPQPPKKELSMKAKPKVVKKLVQVEAAVINGILDFQDKQLQMAQTIVTILKRWEKKGGVETERYPCAVVEMDYNDEDRKMIAILEEDYFDNETALVISFYFFQETGRDCIDQKKPIEFQEPTECRVNGAVVQPSLSETGRSVESSQ
ncbi:hypothetical protein QAD02_020830 [Eretmocerus hayati]|uniref:Uncharacterized protein n=1 Tax=Eretmocerus hayati TaxID=131215 RepID=A0ACC2PNR0_9HYME|nr:hypothetical protein QAD02_020830 [Eretmocerus hayati]